MIWTEQSSRWVLQRAEEYRVAFNVSDEVAILFKKARSKLLAVSRLPREPYQQESWKVNFSDLPPHLINELESLSEEDLTHFVAMLTEYLSSLREGGLSRFDVSGHQNIYKLIKRLTQNAFSSEEWSEAFVLYMTALSIALPRNMSGDEFLLDISRFIPEADRPLFARFYLMRPFKEAPKANINLSRLEDRLHETFYNENIYQITAGPYAAALGDLKTSLEMEGNPAHETLNRMIHLVTYLENWKGSNPEISSSEWSGFVQALIERSIPPSFPWAKATESDGSLQRFYEAYLLSDFATADLYLERLRLIIRSRPYILSLLSSDSAKELISRMIEQYEGLTISFKTRDIALELFDLVHLTEEAKEHLFVKELVSIGSETSISIYGEVLMRLFFSFGEHVQNRILREAVKYAYHFPTFIKSLESKKEASTISPTFLGELITTYIEHFLDSNSQAYSRQAASQKWPEVLLLASQLNEGVQLRVLKHYASHHGFAYEPRFVEIFKKMSPNNRIEILKILVETNGAQRMLHLLQGYAKEMGAGDPELDAEIFSFIFGQIDSSQFLFSHFGFESRKEYVDYVSELVFALGPEYAAFIPGASSFYAGANRPRWYQKIFRKKRFELTRDELMVLHKRLLREHPLRTINLWLGSDISELLFVHENAGSAGALYHLQKLAELTPDLFSMNAVKALFALPRSFEGTYVIDKSGRIDSENLHLLNEFHSAWKDIGFGLLEAFLRQDLDLYSSAQVHDDSSLIEYVPILSELSGLSPRRLYVILNQLDDMAVRNLVGVFLDFERYNVVPFSQDSWLDISSFEVSDADSEKGNYLKILYTLSKFRDLFLLKGATSDAWTEILENVRLNELHVTPDSVSALQKQLQKEIDANIEILFGQADVDKNRQLFESLGRSWRDITPMSSLLVRFRFRDTEKAALPALQAIARSEAEGDFHRLKFQEGFSEADEAKRRAQQSQLTGERWNTWQKTVSLARVEPKPNEQIDLDWAYVRRVLNNDFPAEVVPMIEPLFMALSTGSDIDDIGIIARVEQIRKSIFSDGGLSKEQKARLGGAFKIIQQGLSQRAGEKILASTFANDAQTLMRIGRAVNAFSCQDYETGFYVRALPGYVLDANVQTVLGFELSVQHFSSRSDYNLIAIAITQGRPVQVEYNPYESSFRFDIEDSDMSVLTQPVRTAQTRQIVKLGHLKASGRAALIAERLYHAPGYDTGTTTSFQTLSETNEALIASMASSIGAMVAYPSAESADEIHFPISRNPSGVYSDLAGSIKTEEYSIPVRWVEPRSD